MDAHPHFDVHVLPILGVQIKLRFHGCPRGIARGVERRAKSVANHLEYITLIVLNRSPQDLIVPRMCHVHVLWMFFPKPRAVLNIGEQKRDYARRKIWIHGVTL